MIDDLKMWGRKAALNVQKVLWCADELGLAYEQIDAGQHYGKNKESFFLEMNPNGRVPVIQMNQLSLWESHAILRFLYKAGCGKRLKSPNDWQIAVSDQWLDWVSSYLYYPTFRNYYLYQTRTAEAAKVPEKIYEMQSEVYPLFKILENNLAQNDYAAGNLLTPADFSIGVIVNKWLRIDRELDGFPHTHRYHERLLKRPLFEKNVNVYDLNAV